MKKVLAIDMGATSIRAITGYIEDGKLITKEVMRMSHKIVSENGIMKWQFDELLDKIVNTIIENANEISSIGIDTWGVDFGVLDKEGNLIQTPMSYREPTHRQGYDYSLTKMSEEDIFLNTGNQVMTINTLFQLLAFRQNNPSKWNRVDKILMLPDLFQYIFTGNMVGEETIWSTSQILDLKTGKYSEEILSNMGIDKALFPNIVKSGEKTGSTKNSKLEKLQVYDIDVVSVCGHDTASAVLLTEAFNDDKTMFLSCGTWSLIGGLVPSAVINSKAYEKSLTNEIGYDSKTMFFKNITGLYIIEKFKEQLEKQIGREIDFDEITNYVQSSKEKMVNIDVENEIFAREDVNIKEAIDIYFKETNQTLPKKDMDYFKIIYTSLVNKYLETKLSIEEVSGKSYDKVHLIGGGAKSKYLCQLIADTLKLPVIAGPYEATALGNIIVQLKAVGEIGNIEQGIDLVKKSQKVNYYKPNLL